MRRRVSQTQAIDLNNFLTVEGAAARRGISVATIWRRVGLGQLRTRRVLGRTVFDVAEVDALDLIAGGGRSQRQRSPG